MRLQTGSIPKLALLVVALIALVAIMGCTGPAGPAGPQGPAGAAGAADSDDGYDFTLIADGGTAKQLGGNLYEITLTGVHPNVLAFQNRPHRGFLQFEVEKLVALWEHMFGDGNGAPNVSMVSRDLNGNGQDPTAFSMGPPSRDESSGVLTFEMSLLQGAPPPLQSFTDADLFIDPTSWQWLKLIGACGGAVVAIVSATVMGGLNPLADIAAYGASASCGYALYVVFG